MLHKLLRNHWQIVFLAMAIIALYFPVLNAYFSHDDFFHFNISLHEPTVSEFIRQFRPVPFLEKGYGFYRPISRESLYYLYYSLFGLNQMVFRAFALLLQIVNSFLVYNFIYITFKNKKHALFTALFFAVGSANVGVLYYLAGGIEIQLLTLFTFISLFSFRQYLLKRDIWMRTLAALAFVMALGTHELAIAIPFLLALYTWVIKQLPPKEMVKYIATELIIFWFLEFIFLYVSFVIIGHPQNDTQYQLSFNPKKIMNTFAWYTAWSFGLPEMLVDFVPPGLKLDPRLMQYWGNYFSIIFPTFFVSLFILAYTFVRNITNFIKKLDKRFIFFLLWFPISIAPMLLLPDHKQTYYLGLGLVGFWASIGYILFIGSKRVPTMLVLATVVALAVLNTASIKLSEVTYPAYKRGQIARKLVDDMKSLYPTLPEGATILVKDDPNYPFIADEWGGSAKQASFVLSNENAFQVLYNDKTLKVYFDGQYIPEDSTGQIYPFVAKIPI